MAEEQSKILPAEPVLDPHKEYEEINGYVVFWGLFFAAIFSLAVGYLCLKIGQTVDAFAPVSILSMGMAIIFHCKNAFAETVHIQAIASSGTSSLCGSMFILPALYILNIQGVSAFEMIVPILLGGVLGVFFSVMFRRYFCEEMHYVYPYPSGRAAAEVLLSSEGSKAKLMIASGLIGMAYDFVLNTLGWWKEVISTTTFSWGQAIQSKFKLAMSLDSDAALLGIGYFTGLRYAAIIAAGSFFSWFIAIPIVYYMGGDFPMVVKGQGILLADAPVRAVFLGYVRHVGISSLAYTGNEPVSGMTIFMILVAGVILSAIGMGGQTGMIAVLMMAAFLATCIGVAGNFMAELKVAYLTGATPAKMQKWQAVGCVLFAVVSVGVLVLLNSAYGFVGEGALNAPQANAMAAIVEPLMSGGDAPWPLYMAGAFFAIVLWMVKVPPLAFALGAYLPMEINMPVLVGGLINYLVSTSSDDEDTNRLRMSEGGTIASGLVAGGAIGSLISAILRIAGVDWFLGEWVETPGATYLGMVMYIFLCGYMYKFSMKVKAKKVVAKA